MNINCSCGKRLSVPDGSEGKSGICPSCKKRFRIQAPSSAAGRAPGAEPPKRRPEPREGAVDATRFEFSCDCGNRLSAPKTAVGKLVTCPKCGWSFRVPGLDHPSVVARDARVRAKKAEPPKKPAPAPPAARPAAARPPEPVAAPAKAGAKPVVKASAKESARAVRPEPREAREKAAAPRPAPKAGGGALPWEVSAEVLEKVEAYEAKGQRQAFAGRCNEVLKCLTKADVGGEVARSELVVYPDAVGIVGRPLSLLEHLLLKLLLLALLAANIFYNPIGAFIGIVYNVLDLIFGTIFKILRIPLGLVLAPLFKKLHEWAARKIRENPKGTLAILLKFWLAPLVPRYWQKGEVVQLVRVDLKRFICGMRCFLLLVQDSPLPRRPGCVDTAMPRMLSPGRRIHFIWFLKGNDAAEEAAQAASRVLGLPVERAVFTRRGKFRMA